MADDSWTPNTWLHTNCRSLIPGQARPQLNGGTSKPFKEKRPGKDVGRRIIVVADSPPYHQDGREQDYGGKEWGYVGLSFLQFAGTKHVLNC
jgi:hypothetical protein